VELLVTIAVLGVIMAILLPAVSRVRLSANTSKSVSNMREIGIATQLYIGEHNGRLPNRSNAEWKAPFWPDALTPYLPEEETDIISFRGTPMTINPVVTDPLIEDGQHHPISDYGINTDIFLPVPTEAQRAAGARDYGLISDVPNPSKLVAFVTAESTKYDPPIGSFYFDASNFVFNPARDIRPSSRQIGSMLTLFFDGHVEKIPEQEFIDRRRDLLVP
jgi:type II secretory pathway pseudopilin PulG